MQQRNTSTKEEISEIYHTPLLELIHKAATVHREYHETAEVQVCTLLSIKTGGCPEDCAYCPQAARYDTGLEVQAPLQKRKKFLLTRKKRRTLAPQDFAWGQPGGR